MVELQDKRKFLSVPQQYDYDSSTVRKRICREALLSITLPFIKQKLDPTCRTVSPNRVPDLHRDAGASRLNWDFALTKLDGFCHHGNRHTPRGPAR